MTDRPQQASEADSLKALTAAIKDCDRVMVDKLNAIGCMDTHKFSGDDARALLARAEKAEAEFVAADTARFTLTTERDEARVFMRLALNRVDALQAEVDRLRAAQAWQSIETAPKDGSKLAPSFGPAVLLISKGRSWAIGYFDALHGWIAIESHRPLYSQNWSHWMPLPSPPGAKP